MHACSLFRITMEYGNLQVHLEYLITIAGYDNLHPGCRRLNGIARYLPVVKNGHSDDSDEKRTSPSSSLLSVMKPCVGCKRKLEIEEDRTRAWKKMKLDTVIQGISVPRINTRIADYIITYASPPLHKHNYICKCTKAESRMRKMSFRRPFVAQNVICLNIAALAMQVPDYTILQIHIGKLANVTNSDFLFDFDRDLWRANRSRVANLQNKNQKGISLFVQQEIYLNLKSQIMFAVDENCTFNWPGVQYYIPSKHVTLHVSRRCWGYLQCLDHRFDSKYLACMCPKSPCGRYVLDVIKKHAVPVAEVAAIIREYWSLLL